MDPNYPLAQVYATAQVISKLRDSVSYIPRLSWFCSVFSNIQPSTAKAFGTFSPYDVRIAAHLPDATHFVSSSNITFIPEFPSPPSHTPCCHTDGHLGPHCYTLWPQLVRDDLAHHVCIPQQPVDITDPTYNDIAWVHVDNEKDWQRVGPLEDGIEVGYLDGWIIGQLSTAFRGIEEEIYAVVKELEKVQKFREASLPNTILGCLRRNVICLEAT